MNTTHDTTHSHPTTHNQDDVLETIKAAEEKAIKDIEHHAHKCAQDLQSYKDKKEDELKESEEKLKEEGTAKIAKEKTLREEDIVKHLKGIDGEMESLGTTAEKNKEKAIELILNGIEKTTA